MSSWQALEQELQQWERPPRFWWRDDDAVANTPALQAMLGIAQQHDVVVHLAVIPAHLEPSLPELARGHYQEHCYILQHGVDHSSHADVGQRKIELGGSQNVVQLQQRLQWGRTHLASAFGAQYIDILVPPWNRISDEVIHLLPQIGYRKLSVRKVRKTDRAIDQVNIHLDIINWNKRAFAGEDIVLGALIEVLAYKRKVADDVAEPIGLMTHHLDHDEQCWAFLQRFFAFMKSRVQWVAGPALLSA